MMKKIVVASTNPVKIDSVSNAFRKMFDGEDITIEGYSVESGVNDQPLSDQETLRGAKNRIDRIFENYGDADFWIGIEGGIEDYNSEMAAFAWVMIKDKNGLIGKSRSGTFFLPKIVAEKIRNGVEMGIVNDEVFKKSNSKQNSGAIGILTHGVVNRTQLYEHAVSLALVAFRNKELYM